MKIRQKQGPRKVITLRTTRSLARQIKAEAERLNISTNEWIVRELAKATE